MRERDPRITIRSSDCEGIMDVRQSFRYLTKPASALALAMAGLVVLIGGAGAATPAVPSMFVPITPCRLVDTRPSEQVGTRGLPIGMGETVSFAVRGTHGNCTIPTTAVAIATNTTAVNPTAPSFLTVWPADAAKPLSSNLNWLPSSPPTPNQVTVGLSASGAISVYNLDGTIDVVIDIVGYYVPPAAQQPPAAYAATRTTVASLPPAGGVNGSITVNSMFLPAGTYLVTFTTTIVNFSASTDFFRCGIFNAGNIVAANAVLLGPNVGSVVPMTVQAVLTLTFAGTTSVGSTCLHDANLAAGSNIYLDPGATLTAVPITLVG